MVIIDGTVQYTNRMFNPHNKGTQILQLNYLTLCIATALTLLGTQIIIILIFNVVWDCYVKILQCHIG